MAIVGVGIDVTRVERLEELLSRHGDRTLNRLFTPAEQAVAAERVDRTRYLAGRLAAKEAVMKVLGTGWGKGVGWKDVEVHATEAGPPRVELHGEAARFAESLGIVHLWLSISHDGDLAVATAVGES
jgi:holo-[acyl-carrier protein] synthase